MATVTSAAVEMAAAVPARCRREIMWAPIFRILTR
jgi:hypothetical protein